MKRYCTIFLALLSVYGWAQSAKTDEQKEKDILKCTDRQIGIYKAFEEFRRNAPSIRQEFAFLKYDKKSKKPYLEAEKDRLKLLDPRGRTSPVLDMVWGFSDSTGVYIYFEDRYQLGRRYNKLKNIGRYCYFLDEYDMPTKSGKGRGRHITREYVLNINDGNAYEFSEEALKRILAKDPELLRKFEQEKDKGPAMYQYLLRFNERNPDTVKPI